MLLVECLQQPPTGSAIIKDLGRWGRYVFQPQEDYQGRCIVEVPTLQHQQQLLDANPPGGKRIFVVPQDILDRQTRELMREVVREVLSEIGLWPSIEAVAANEQTPSDTDGLGSPERRKPGRPKKA